MPVSKPAFSFKLTIKIVIISTILSSFVQRHPRRSAATSGDLGKTNYPYSPFPLTGEAEGRKCSGEAFFNDRMKCSAHKLAKATQSERYISNDRHRVSEARAYEARRWGVNLDKKSQKECESKINHPYHKNSLPIISPYATLTLSGRVCR